MMYFQIIRSFGSSTCILIPFPEDYDVQVLHFDDYIFGNEGHVSYIWHSINKGTHKCSKTKEHILNLADYSSLCKKLKDPSVEENEKIGGDLKAKRDLRFTLPLDTFRLVRSLPTTHDIWKILKELYLGDVDQTHSIQKALFSEFGSFKQNFDEIIDHVANRLNHLLIRMLKCKLDQ